MKELNQLQRDTILAQRVQEITNLYNNLLQNVGTIKGLAENNNRQLSRILNLPKGEKGDKGDIGPRGLIGKAGKDGVDGKDGFTPVKGVDYFTKNEEEALLLKTLARITQPKDGETPIVDEDAIAEKAAEIIREKQLLNVKDIKGVSEELTSYRHQMAMKQAGQHGGGDTIVAGTNIELTRNANGTTTISAVGAGTGSVTTVSVVSANGFAGTVANATTTPAITLTTSVTGILKGNGTAISAAVAGDVDSILPDQTGNSGKYLTTDGTNSSWGTIAGGGNVSNTGTPLNNQIAVWTNATTIEGDADLTFDTTTNTLSTGILNSSTLTASEIVITDGSKNLVSAAVATYPSLTELTYLKGVTSSIQTQLNAKAASLSGTNNEIAYFNSATTISSLTTATYPSLTELSYVKGVTSAIQTQLNAKQATISFGTGVETALGVNVGTAGSIVVNGGALGTPSSGTVTNLTGTASININGTVGATTPTTATFTTATINTSLLPDANDGAVLGASGTAFSDLFLATGGTIDWNAGDVNITHAANTLNFTGATSGFLFGNFIGPVVDDGSALGTTSARWSDLFLAEGAVINWDNGDLTLTQSGNSLTLAGGDLVLAENTSVQLDPALSADGTYSGITITGTAGTTLAFGDLVYLAVADSRWELCDADSVTTAGAVLTGMCVLAAAGDGSATTILLQGNIRADAAFPALTIGANVYAGLTPGDIVTTAPSATDDVVHVVGKALTADSIYFNPSPDYITVV